MLKEAGWISQAGMHSARNLSLIAIFSSLTIATDYALAPALNVKLMDTLVFSSAYAFGFRIGASIAILSELVWGLVSPYGFFLPIIPFLVVGELLYATAGYLASRIWGMEKLSTLSPRNLFFGAILAICAFVWDFETNIATGLLALWPRENLAGVLFFEVTGIPFMIPHELSDFILGATLAPVIIVYSRRLVMKGYSSTKMALAQSEVR